jgi:hypothetical protein
MTTNELKHYSEMADALEKRIDAVGTIFASLGGFEGDDIPEVVTDALLDLGCDRVEIQLGIEKAGC